MLQLYRLKVRARTYTHLPKTQTHDQIHGCGLPSLRPPRPSPPPPPPHRHHLHHHHRLHHLHHHHRRHRRRRRHRRHRCRRRRPPAPAVTAAAATAATAAAATAATTATATLFSAELCLRCLGAASPSHAQVLRAHPHHALSTAAAPRADSLHKPMWPLSAVRFAHRARSTSTTTATTNICVPACRVPLCKRVLSSPSSPFPSPPSPPPPSSPLSLFPPPPPFFPALRFALVPNAWQGVTTCLHIWIYGAP